MSGWENFLGELNRAGSATQRKLTRLRAVADAIDWRASKANCEEAKAAHQVWAKAAEEFMNDPAKFERDAQGEETPPNTNQERKTEWPATSYH